MALETFSLSPSRSPSATDATVEKNVNSFILHCTMQHIQFVQKTCIGTIENNSGKSPAQMNVPPQCPILPVDEPTGNFRL
jgi:hypothetical protein